MTSSFPRGRQALGLLGWLLLTFAAGALGAVASAQAAGFYSALARPDWAPRYTDYGHLARVQEWSAGGGEPVE